MDITKSNFKEFLPIVTSAIEEADFLAIDTELTGLNTLNNEHVFDTLEERYLKLRQGASKFLIIQFGLSAFHYHKAQRKYTHKDFNFYTFPRPHSRQAPDPCFLSQASSLDYLTFHGFDFNKLFREGISYLTPFQERRLKKELEERHKDQTQALSQSVANGTSKSNSQKEFIVKEENKAYVDDVHNQVEELIKSDRSILELPPTNAFLRKVVYETVKQKYPTGLDLSTSVNEKKERYIVIAKANEQQMYERLQGRQSADLNELDDAVGFRKVMKLISQSNKLVVGHNMLLDILHIVDQFYSDLPERYEEFKEITNCIFSRLLDTKLVASSNPFKEHFSSTVLNDVLTKLHQPPFDMPSVEPADGFKGYTLENDKQHEAGYDAFITGVCYVGFSTHLASVQKKPQHFISPESSILDPYVNRLYIMKHFDIQAMNLRGADPQPRRDHVFYVTFPKDWRTSDLAQLFSPYGSIYVSWLDEKSALVALNKPDQTTTVKKNLVNNKSNKYRVMLYSDYKERQRILNTPLAWERQTSTLQTEPNYPKRRRSSSSMDKSLSNRSIDTIPEEEEEKEEGEIEDDQDEPKNKKQKYSKDNRSSDKTARKLKDTRSPDNSSQPEKLFTEPDTWI